MRGGRILRGQIAVVLTIVLITTWAATEWTAWRLGFQPQLGSPWFELAGRPIYLDVCQERDETGLHGRELSRERGHDDRTG